MSIRRTDSVALRGLGRACPSLSEMDMLGDAGQGADEGIAGSFTADLRRN